MPRPPTYRERYANMLAGQGTMRSYEPSFQEALGYGVRQLGGEQKLQDFNKLSNWVPGLGDAMDVDEITRAGAAGNYGDAAILAGLAVLPGSAVKAKEVLKGGTKKAKELAKHLSKAVPTTASASKYLKDPVREYSPGIYKPPTQIAQEAEAQVAPENPAMRELFGVTREDLADIGGRGTRPGNMPPSILTRGKPKGSYVAEGVMTPQNAGRIADALQAAEKHAPGLVTGMDAWYVMDPAYWQLEKVWGPDEAKRLYSRFNTATSMHSPGSDVLTELNRGTAANMMIDQGQFDLYQKYGGVAAKKRGADFPAQLRDVIGHPYHSTAQAGPLAKYLETGKVDMTQPKVPLYMQASGVPETGFQTKLPVPDAHFTRAIGASDVRTTANPGASMRTPEYAPIGPWFRENVANQLGIEAVPAQARTWGLFAPQTGVDTPIGAPKLELLAQRISERAKKLGVDPKKLRDDVLSGKAHASWLLPLLVGSGVARTQQEKK